MRRLYGCARRGCDAVNPDYLNFGAHGKSWCLHHRPLRARLRVWWQERRNAHNGDYVDLTGQDVLNFLSMLEKRTFVIGDLHGHLDRFEALLRQEGLLGPCDVCGHTAHPGQVRKRIKRRLKGRDIDGGYEYIECGLCNGLGVSRYLRDEVEVVLVGDIGHWGVDGSPTGDLMTLQAATLWADVILWGNHDRALVEDFHRFRGYMRPTPEAYHLLSMADMKLAHESYGYLITHAGLAYAFKFQKDVPEEVFADPAAFVAWINEVADPMAEGTPSQIAVRDAIGSIRGGSGTGGILWRDINEKLYDGYRQVFGHSADHKKGMVRGCNKSDHTRSLDRYGEYQSFCIDVGGKNNGALAGIYLPDLHIARVDL